MVTWKTRQQHQEPLRKTTSAYMPPCWNSTELDWVSLRQVGTVLTSLQEVRHTCRDFLTCLPSNDGKQARCTAGLAAYPMHKIRCISRGLRERTLLKLTFVLPQKTSLPYVVVVALAVSGKTVTQKGEKE